MSASVTVGGMRALIVRGGADFHDPIGTTDSFRAFLEASGYQVDISDSLDVYRDAGVMAAADLIIQCWTGGELTEHQSAGLCAAVIAGTGFGGWHGGAVAAFADRQYQWMTGAAFLCHPGDFVRHELVVTSDHPIVAGIDRVALDTERYWVLGDAANDVHATITFPVEDGEPWTRPVTHPAVWTRSWGAGRVFVSAVGHHLPDLQVPEIRTITERGLHWATRRSDT
jgi:type 1 glutamine amidotransferase